MHEAALLHDLRRKVDELSRAYGGAEIVRARVAFGPLSHLDEASLRHLWSEAMAHGPASGAQLEVDRIESLADPWASSVVLRSVTFRTSGPSASSSREG